jgi:hypothetical protein
MVVEMSRACSKHGGHEKCIQNCLEDLKGRDNSEDLGVDGKIILEWNLQK